MSQENYGKKLIAFTAPSGAGKTTIVKHLLEIFPFLGFSVSATTRSRRSYEVEGEHYYFLSHKDFMSKVKAGEFAEYEEVYANQYYGTLKSEIERNWENHKVVVFDIDVKGAAKLKEVYKEDCFVVFIKPPSLQALIDRLKKRKTETEESLRKRVARARQELSFAGRFDTILVNDLLEVAVKEAELMIKDFLDIEIDGNQDD
jgi:guanylate kinase